MWIAILVVMSTVAAVDVARTTMETYRDPHSSRIARFLMAGLLLWIGGLWILVLVSCCVSAYLELRHR